MKSHQTAPGHTLNSRTPRSEYVASLALAASRRTRQDALRTAYAARRTPSPHWAGELVQWLVSPAEAHHYIIAGALLVLGAV